MFVARDGASHRRATMRAGDVARWSLGSLSGSPGRSASGGYVRNMTTTQSWILLVEVGVVALGALVAMLRR
jgi:hypothetical protein